MAFKTGKRRLAGLGDDNSNPDNYTYDEYLECVGTEGVDWARTGSTKLGVDMNRNSPCRLPEFVAAQQTGLPSGGSLVVDVTGKPIAKPQGNSGGLLAFLALLALLMISSR
jgi:hypothetical protein